VAPLDQVLEPAGGRHDDLRLLGGGDLRLEARSAVDGGHAEPARLRDRLRLGDDLRRQLTRGCEHERGGRRVVASDAVRDRNRERERLARARRGLDEDVPPGQSVGKDPRLDREGLVYAARAKRADHLLGYAELGEGSNLHVDTPLRPGTTERPA
jgi:hypothetical protein